MPKGSQTPNYWRLCMGVLTGLCIVAALSACKPSRPTVGVFPIKVIVLTSDQAGIPNVSVQINGKEIGKTDKYGTFVGTHKGKVGTSVRIKVVGAGKENFFVFKKPLKMRKTQRGWIPLEIKVNAFLQPASMDSGGGDNAGGDNKIAQVDTAGDKKGGDNAGDKQGGDNAGDKQGGDNAGDKQGGDNAGDKQGGDNAGDKKGGDNAGDKQGGDNAGGGTKKVAAVVQPEPRPEVRPEPRPETRREVKPPPPPGKYEISIKSNVANTRVYCRGCRRRYLGKIRDAGGALVYSHKDRRRTPRALKFTLRLLGRKMRCEYKETKFKQELALDTGRTQYEVSANFEKKPVKRIEVTATLADIKVYLGRKMHGVISDPSQPYVIEYAKCRRSVVVTMRPKNRKVRPRRIRKRVRFKKDEFTYKIEGKFRGPKPRRLAQVPKRNPGSDTPAMPGGSDTPAMPGGGNTPPPPPEPRPKKFDGKYKITITSNAAGILVYRGRRRLGLIPEAGGSLVYTHKDRRKRPRRLTLRFRAKNRFAYMKRQKTVKVALEYGRADYQVQVSFDKRKPLQFTLKSNTPGVVVYVNRKKAGSISGPGKPLVYEYNGRPMRRATIIFRSPNRKLFRPSRVRQRVRIESGRYAYEVTGNFTEYDPGDKVVLKPRCLRRKRGRRRTVMLKASPGTRFVLKGDCNEPLAKVGKSGRIKVAMPTGTFQRVWAVRGGGKTQKVFEVVKGGGVQIVSFGGPGRRCSLGRIKKKIINKIPLEEEEVKCLKKVRRNNKQFFSAQLFLARFYCQQKMRTHGNRLLNMLGSKARNRFNPYRTLQLGIEFGRCKKYSSAVRFLKYTEQRINRFSPADRTQNRIALYRSMATIYEQLYYRRKNTIDLTRALKSAERLADIVPGGQKAAARKEVSRLKKLITQKGGLDD